MRLIDANKIYDAVERRHIDMKQIIAAAENGKKVLTDGYQNRRLS